MREILFRGKRVDNDEWIFGNIVHQTDYYGDSCDRWFILEGDDTYDYDIDYPIEVQKKTIGQYTNITDKNGVKIFEGDIVNVFYNPNYIGVSKDRVGNFIVVFHDSCFMKRKITKPMSDDAGLYHFIQSDEFEVIGNIYDNPELMGGNTNGRSDKQADGNI